MRAIILAAVIALIVVACATINVHSGNNSDKGAVVIKPSKNTDKNQTKPVTEPPTSE